MFSIKTFAQPKADFTVNTVHGCNSLQAHFTDNSIGSPTTWFWDFGNGQTSIVQNPAIFYAAPGKYTVSLVVTNDAGNDMVIKTDYITVDIGPVASFNYSVSGGCLPLDVNFTDNTNPGDGAITNWFWDFGDGTTANVANPLHTYTTDSNFSVSLTIQQSNGCSATNSVTNAISAGAKPAPSFFTNQLIVCASAPVNFTNKTTGNVTAYYWDFDDGDTSTKKGPSHYFQDTGFMDIKLIAYNYGCADSAVLNNYVYIKPPIVRIRYNFSCDSPYVRNFQAKFLGEKSYTWDFGDGTSTSIQKFPVHTYQNPGTYMVKLSAVANECNYEDTLTVYVIDEHPAYTFTSNNSITCKHDTVWFKAGNYNPAYVDAFAWDYGDGNVSMFSKSGTSAYVYRKSGKYYPSLIIRDIQGCYDTIHNNISIDIFGPQAAFIINPYTCVNFNTAFTDLSSGDGSASLNKWIWDYGDGFIDTLQAGPFYHSYNSVDTFSVKLKIIDANGCADTLIKTKELITIAKPLAVFNIIDTVSCFASPVSFFDQSAGQVLGRMWYLGDGDTSTGNNFQHLYSQPGIYPISLIIGNQKGCSDTARGEVRVVPPPEINAGSDTVLCYGQGISFQPAGAAAYSWISDQSLSCYNCQHPFIQPQTSATYFVTGTDIDGCSAIDSVYVEVKPVIKLALENNIDTICFGQSVQLFASGAEIYNWQPSPGLNSSTIPNPVASPASTTFYTVIGTDSKNCFRDTAIVTIGVHQNPKFNIIDTSVTIAGGSNYLIQTTSSPDVISWQWVPPTDLSCSNCPQPTVKGDKIIEYTGTAYNIHGCIAVDKIKVKGLCNNEVIFIPNTFSPNNDNINDWFYPRGKGLYRIKSMRIFNRLGQTVFQKLNFQPDAANQGWDGTYYSRKLPSDVYIYHIEILCNNGVTVTFNGDVTLLL